MPDKEHVTFYILKNSKFKTIQLDNNVNWSKFRYTVDYEEDFLLVKKIIKEIKQKKIIGTTAEIVNLIKKKFDVNIKKKELEFGYGWKQKLKLLAINLVIRCNAGKSSEYGTGHLFRSMKLLIFYQKK